MRGSRRTAKSDRSKPALLKEARALAKDESRRPTGDAMHGTVRHIHRLSHVYVSGAAQRRGVATRVKFSKTKRNSKLRKELRTNQRVNA